MPLTWKEAKDLLSQYAGRGGVCPTSDKVNIFVRQVLEYMLVSGSYGNLRKFCFNARKGCFTVPFELEVPIKIKIDGEVETAWDKWFEFHSAKDLDERGCIAASEGLQEDPNYYPTVYDLPAGGARVGVLGTCSEEEDAHVIVQGIDTKGREIFTTHEGQQIAGEYLRIRKGDIRYTLDTFSKVTGIIKTKTTGYVQLFWVRPEFNAKGFLSDYSPLEEKPSYRRYNITSRNCGSLVKVTVLGRIRLKAAYADTDYIPFDNLYTLTLAAQAINANYNNDVPTASAKDKMMQDIITRENEYKRVQNGSPVECFQPLSAGAIKNIV